MQKESIYWDQHFPWKSICRFLCQGNPDLFKQREIAIRKPSYFQRNKPFETLEQLKDKVLGNGQKNDLPAERIEFGPLFPGTDRADSRLDDMPLRVEFRFDVDVKDYSCDDHLYGKGCLECSHFAYSPACKECWETRLEPSRKVLEYLLKEILGAKHILWVFSGKKGYHGIVLDREISSSFYPNTVRENIVNRLIDPKDEKMLNHIYNEILWPIFKEQYLDNEHVGRKRPMGVFFDGIDRKGRFFDTIPEIFNYIKKCVFEGDAFKMRQYYRRVMRALYWPRLDAKISSDVQHLLKIPFSIHDGTKKISTPILDTENFRPEDALTLEEVCQNPEKLEPYVKHFEELMDRAYAEEEEEDSSSSYEEKEDDDGVEGVFGCKKQRIRM